MKFLLVVTSLLAFTTTALSAPARRFLEASEACITAYEAISDKDTNKALYDAANEQFSEFVSVTADALDPEKQQNDDGFCSHTNTSIICTDMNLDELVPAQATMIEECQKIEGATAYKINLKMDCSGGGTVQASISNLADCYPKECSAEDVKAEAQSVGAEVGESFASIFDFPNMTCTTDVTDPAAVANPSAGGSDTPSAGNMMAGVATAGLSALFAAAIGMW